MLHLLCTNPRERLVLADGDAFVSLSTLLNTAKQIVGVADGVMLHMLCWMLFCGMARAVRQRRCEPVPHTWNRASIMSLLDMLLEGGWV